jgi:hypothetical protein
MGRKPLSPEEKQARKKARSHAYYEANKERILQKVKESYDPEKKREYYNAHIDEIKETQRVCNIRRNHTRNFTAIQNALQNVDDSVGFKDTIKLLMNSGERLMKDDTNVILRLIGLIK